jgi:hypothetical protein
MNNILNTLKGYTSSFVSINSSTTPKLLVGKCKAQFGVHPNELNIVKHTTLVGLVGTKVDYATLVENRLLKEADLKGSESNGWEKEERRWGERVDGVHVTHKGKDYVTVHCVAANKPQVRYEIDGKEVDTDTLAKIKNCFSDSGSKKQAEAGIEKQVVYRDYGLDSINSIKVGGEVITD